MERIMMPVQETKFYVCGQMCYNICDAVTASPLMDFVSRLFVICAVSFCPLNRNLFLFICLPNLNDALNS